MIKLFGNKETEKIYLGVVSKKYPPDIQQIARRKLKMLHASQNLKEKTKNELWLSYYLDC
jgi:proteic killer suppression protein